MTSSSISNGCFGPTETHPFVTLLADRRIGLLAAGLALSAIGTELNRVAVVWLAIELVGPDASLLFAASNAVILVVSLAGGLFADRFPPRGMMIACNLLAAVFAVVPVAAAALQGLSFASLIASIVGLAACGGLFQPALLSSVPRLAGTRERIQGTNALLDATSRLSRLAGPFLAGLLSLVLAPLHFLVVNALSYLVSAAAVASLGRALDVKGLPPPSLPILKRLTRGYDSAARQPAARLILVANTAVLAAWTVGLSLGLPLLVATSGVTGLGLTGLGAVAALMAAYGAGDFFSNVLVAGARPRRLGRFMFAGYVILGGALALVPLPLLLLPEPVRLPAMMMAAFGAGMGGPMFFIPMMTFLQTHIDGPDLASVIRLRLALIAASMMIGAAGAPVLFREIGVIAAVVVVGSAIAAVGLWGALRHPDLG